MNKINGLHRLAICTADIKGQIAFVQSPAVAEVPVQIGQSHAGNPSQPCAAGAA